MLTTGMLAGLLKAMPENSSLILLGDPNQLLSVGAGNAIHNLITIGVPYVRLMGNHRQCSSAWALNHNVSCFDQIQTVEDLRLDDSFQLREEGDVDMLIRLASQLYYTGASVYVLAATNADVQYLNSHIHAHVNPYGSSALPLRWGPLFYCWGSNHVSSQRQPAQCLQRRHRYTPYLRGCQRHRNTVGWTLSGMDPRCASVRLPRDDSRLRDDHPQSPGQRV